MVPFGTPALPDNMVSVVTLGNQHKKLINKLAHSNAYTFYHYRKYTRLIVTVMERSPVGLTSIGDRVMRLKDLIRAPAFV